MNPICKNCANFFHHKENYTRQGFCRRFNQVQFRDEKNENCFSPTKEVENHFRNIKKAEALGLTVQDLPKLRFESEEMTNFLYQKELAKDEFTRKQQLLNKQLELFT